MSEINTSDGQGNAEDNIEGLKNKNKELLGKLGASKEQNELLNGKLDSLNDTVSSLSKLMGVEEGENVADKAKSLLAEKEKKAFDAMSETDKLNHRLASIETELNQTKLEKDKAEQRELGLRIDDKIKSALNANGVKGANELNDALDIIKARNSINSIQDDVLTMDNGQIAIGELVGSLLKDRPYLVSNTSKGGSGFNGGVRQNADKAQYDQAIKSKDTKGALRMLVNGTN